MDAGFASSSAALADAGETTSKRVTPVWLWHARAAGVISAVFLLNFTYLAWNCPLDLTEDEAYYWDWSRRLDLSYFSKGPLVAYLIRAGCAVVGDTPLGVRFPALCLSAGTGLLTYWLTRRLFGSDRLAFGALLLSHLTPIAVSRGLVMTIDAPLFFCWALATCCAYLAVVEGKGWAWPATGAAVGLGLLAKFSMGLWFVGLAAWLMVDRRSRRHVRVRHVALAAAVSLLFLTPVLLWNYRHQWVTAHHVGENVGVSSAAIFSAAYVADFWAGQFGVVGPIFFLLLAAAVFKTLREYSQGPDASPVRFLLCMSLPFFLFVLAASFRTNPGANWTMPAYFTLYILLAHVLGRAWRGRTGVAWKRGLVLAVGSNLVLIGMAYFSEHLYAPYQSLASRFGLPRDLMRVDPTARVRGFADLGRAASNELRELSPGAFVLADRYQLSAALAFYVEGQPETYCAGSYFSDDRTRRGLSQYDLWPDRDLARPDLLGRDAVYAGTMNDDVRAAFHSVEPAPEVAVERQGVRVRNFTLWRCRGFKGMTRPVGRVRYW